MSISLAIEKKHAQDLAEREKRMREQEQAAARKKEAEMSGMFFTIYGCMQQSLMSFCL